MIYATSEKNCMLKVCVLMEFSVIISWVLYNIERCVQIYPNLYYINNPTQPNTTQSCWREFLLGRAKTRGGTYSQFFAVTNLLELKLCADHESKHCFALCWILSLLLRVLCFKGFMRFLRKNENQVKTVNHKTPSSRLNISHRAKRFSDS